MMEQEEDNEYEEKCRDVSRHTPFSCRQIALCGFAKTRPRLDASANQQHGSVSSQEDNMLLGEDPRQTSLAFLLNIVFADSQMSTSTLPTSSQEPAVAMAATTRRDPFIALGPTKGTSHISTSNAFCIAWST